MKPRIAKYVTNGMAIFMAVLCALHPAISLATEPIPKSVSLTDLGICEDKAKKVFGMFTPICRLLISSPNFRAACAEVPEADRIRCDGSEPTTMALISLDARAECAKKFAAGFSDNLQDSYEFLSDLVSMTASLAGAAASWMFSPAEAADIPLTDDISPYVESTLADSGETVDWGTLLMSRDFWEIFQQEARIAIEDMGKESISASVRYFCYNPMKRHEVTCELAGGFLGVGAVLKVLKLVKRAKMLPKDKIRQELRKIFAEQKSK